MAAVHVHILVHDWHLHQRGSAPPGLDGSSRQWCAALTQLPPPDLTGKISIGWSESARPAPLFPVQLLRFSLIPYITSVTLTSCHPDG